MDLSKETKITECKSCETPIISEQKLDFDDKIDVNIG